MLSEARFICFCFGAKIDKKGTREFKGYPATDPQRIEIVSSKQNYQQYFHDMEGRKFMWSLALAVHKGTGVVRLRSKNLLRSPFVHHVSRYVHGTGI